MNTIRWLLLIQLLFCTLASASSIILTWSANSEPDLLGYRVHWGTLSKKYTQSIDVGLATQCEIAELTPGYRYYFGVTAVDHWGNESRYSVEVSAVPGGDAAVPVDYELETIIPNPLFSGQYALLRFAQPEQRTIHLAVYNCLGQRVRTLFKGENPAGFHQLAWEGLDDAGRALPTGVYFCRLQSGETVLHRPFTIVR
ncbi:fibronectin type III domain-containing protein [candidate division KSB1 bacterium]|nr:fibronectin type III domain-containing protein [candidate division KSB1 bacterium]